MDFQKASWGLYAESVNFLDMFREELSRLSCGVLLLSKILHFEFMNRQRTSSVEYSAAYRRVRYS